MFRGDFQIMLHVRHVFSVDASECQTQLVKKSLELKAAMQVTYSLYSIRVSSAVSMADVIDSLLRAGM